MLDGIPFRRSRRVVGHGNGYSPAIGHLLQVPLPSPGAHVVTAAAVRFDKPVPRLRTTPPTLLPPPDGQSIGHEGSRLVRRSHHHKTGVALGIVNAEGNSAATAPAGEIMIPNIDRDAPPSSPRVLEQAHLFFLLGIDADRGISLLLEAPTLPGNIAKLPVALRFVRPCQALAVRAQRIFLRLQQSCHGGGTDLKSQTPQGLRQFTGGLACPAQSRDRISGRRVLDECLQLLHHAWVFFSRRLRPAPGRGMRGWPGPIPRCNSAMPRRTAVRLRPLISATLRMPLCPRRSAKSPANKRRCRSSSVARIRLTAWWSRATVPCG